MNLIYNIGYGILILSFLYFAALMVTLGYRRGMETKLHKPKKVKHEEKVKNI